jgi:hypothetical protein
MTKDLKYLISTGSILDLSGNVRSAVSGLQVGACGCSSCMELYHSLSNGRWRPPGFFKPFSYIFLGLETFLPISSRALTAKGLRRLLLSSMWNRMVLV